MKRSPKIITSNPPIWRTRYKADKRLTRFQRWLENYPVKVSAASGLVTLIAVVATILYSNKNLNISKLSYDLSSDVASSNKKLQFNSDKNNAIRDTQLNRVIRWEDSVMDRNSKFFGMQASALINTYNKQLSEDPSAVELIDYAVDGLPSDSVEVTFYFHNA